MSKILFVNQEKGQCGVYQFGKNTAFILSKFNDIHEFDYLETINPPEIRDDYGVVVLNHHPCTMPWATPSFFSKYANQKFATIMHDNRIVFPNVAILHPDPTFTSEYPDLKIGRPILDISSTKKPLENTIGSFGFGFDHKGFGELVNRVNEEFEQAHLRIHIPLNTKVDQSGGYAFTMTVKLRKIKLKDGIKLTITHDYKNELDLLEWLSENTINVFLYRETKRISSGCSSTVDWALAAKRPLGVSNDPMFRHITAHAPEVIVDNNSIKSIMEAGVASLEYFYQNWTERKLYEEYCGVINEIICASR